MHEQELSTRAIRFSHDRDGEEVGHAYLYLIHNNLHAEPYGLLEDMYVHEQHRKNRIGAMLLQAILECARREGCYKVIANSRNGVERESVQSWYVRTGFVEHGKEFRMDL
jgi:GNAT superfamily N-acetyltransferase